MTLRDYLDQQNLSCGAFGRLGGWSDETVRQWSLGGRMPRRDAMAKIAELTSGAVTFADFYGDIAPAPSPDAEAAA